MNDRLQLDRVVLDNGITVYSKRADVPFAYARIYVPVGHVHNTGPILSGTAHFLEHMACNASAAFPEHDSFKRFVGLRGGTQNASTMPHWTRYIVQIPTEHFEMSLRGVAGMAFEPTLSERHLKSERTVISNERKKSNRWFPGKTELEYHTERRWKHNEIVSLQQMLGSDEDLAQIDLPRLRELHRFYFDPRVFALVAGNFDLDLVCRELSRFKIGVATHELPELLTPLSWNHREYHEARFAEVSRFVFHLGGVVSSGDLHDIMGNSFLGVLLTNSVHGVLYTWLRDELGWVYGMDFDIWRRDPRCNSDWELSIPLNNMEQVDFIRANWRSRLEAMIRDESLLRTEVERRVAANVFHYQTMEQVLAEQEKGLLYHGCPFTEFELYNILRRFIDPRAVADIYQRFWSVQQVGEFLAIPENA